MSHSLVDLAILGCGAVAGQHARTLSRFGPEVRCHYASRDPARAAAFAARHHGAGAFGSYERAIADPAIDAVLVATPPESHLALVLDALAHGKHAIVEKPAFLRAADCVRARAAEVQSGRRVFVAENYCYKPLAAVLRDVLAGGDLGEVRFVHIDAVKHQRVTGWRADPTCTGGGALFEGGVHWIDLLAHLGLHVEAVHGFRPGDWRGGERSMLVVVEYEEGAVGTLAHSWEIPSPFRGLRLSRIYGTRGSVLFESNGLFVRVTGSRPRLLLPGLRDLGGYHAMFRDFLRSIRTGAEPLMSLARAQRGLELIEAAYRSAPFAPELEAVS